MNLQIAGLKIVFQVHAPDTPNVHLVHQPYTWYIKLHTQHNTEADPGGVQVARTPPPPAIFGLAMNLCNHQMLWYR